jgi:CRP-like cAMP-binding protein
MSVDIITPSLKSMPLFADLEESKLEGFQRIFRPVAFAPGDLLMTQGQAADAIFFLESGTVAVLMTLPGGGEHTISTLGPGSVIGEMALLDEIGTRTATVRAVTPTRGFLIERQDCRVLLTQTQNTTFTVQRRITLSLCQRLRELLAMVSRFHASYEQPGSLLSAERHSPASVVRHKELAPKYREILPQLPFFLHFRADEVEQVLEQATILTVSRGHVLFRQSDPGQASYIIVRGAVELLSSDAAPSYTLSVLGPGRVCGHIALIDDAPHETTAVTRSEAVLLEYSRQSFARLCTANTRAAAKFSNAVLQNLLLLQAKVDNHFARMISQAFIRTQRHG